MAYSLLPPAVTAQRWGGGPGVVGFGPGVMPPAGVLSLFTPLQLASIQAQAANPSLLHGQQSSQIPYAQIAPNPGRWDPPVGWEFPGLRGPGWVDPRAQDPLAVLHQVLTGQQPGFLGPPATVGTPAYLGPPVQQPGGVGYLGPPVQQGQHFKGPPVQAKGWTWMKGVPRPRPQRFGTGSGGGSAFNGGFLGFGGPDWNAPVSAASGLQ